MRRSVRSGFRGRVRLVSDLPRDPHREGANSSGIGPIRAEIEVLESAIEGARPARSNLLAMSQLGPKRSDYVDLVEGGAPK
jgi:hypothetical protein